VHEPVPADPGEAELYRRLRPLVEQSTTALADVLTALDAAHEPGSSGPLP
jgi:gluconokinase